MTKPQTHSIGNRYRLEQLLGRGGMGSVYQAHDRLTGQRVALKLVPVEQPAEPLVAPSTGAETLAANLSGSATTSSPMSRATPRQPILPPLLTAELTAPSLFSRAPPSVSKVYLAASLPPDVTNPMWTRVALAQEFRVLAALQHPHIISVLDYGFFTPTQPFFTMELLLGARSLKAASRGLSLTAKAELLMQLLGALCYLHRHGIVHREQFASSRKSVLNFQKQRLSSRWRWKRSSA